jgi:hypothetical protein
LETTEQSTEHSRPNNFRKTRIQQKHAKRKRLWPCQIGGIGIEYLFTCQGAQMTTAMTTADPFNTRAKTGIGEQMTVANDWAQLMEAENGRHIMILHKTQY